MSTILVQPHRNLLSDAVFLGDGAVKHHAESWIQEIPALYAEGLNTEINKDLSRRFIQKVLNEGELSLISDFMSPDVVSHELADSLGDVEPRPGQHIAWITELVYLYRQAFPDLSIEIESQTAEEDRVVTFLRMRGTQKNALMSIAASGRKIDIAGINVDRMAGGKIIESWLHFDALGMLRQLGALPVLDRRPPKVGPVYENALGATPSGALWNPTSALQSALVI